MNKKILYIALLIGLGVVSGGALIFAQTPLDSDIVTVITPAPPTGTGTIYFKVMVGNAEVTNPADNNSCVSKLNGPAGSDTPTGCIRSAATNKPFGNYSLQWLSGYPTGAKQESPIITPSSATLSAANPTATFTMTFAPATGTIYFKVMVGNTVLTSSADNNGCRYTLNGDNDYESKGDCIRSAITGAQFDTYSLEWIGNSGYPTGAQHLPPTITPSSATLSATNLTATFTMTFAATPGQTYSRLIVTKPGSGYGLITASSTSGSFSCAGGQNSDGTQRCSILVHDYGQGETVYLEAIADNGSTFAGWGGACASFGSNSNCTVEMNSDKTASATFILNTVAGYNCVNNQCVFNSSGGTYSNLPACQAACPVPPGGYNCVNNNQCVFNSSGGTYSNLPACQAVCPVPPGGYNCGVNYQCEAVSSGGTYSSLSSCQAVCQPPVPPAPVYTFFCRTTSDTSILLSWVGSVSRQHQLEVLGGDSNTGLSVIAARSAGAGSFEDKPLAAGATRYYQLKINYTDSGTPASELTPASPISCTTLAMIPQDPTLLNVTTLSASSLYMTWKDNAVRPHNFASERIKVTPASSAAVAAARDAGGIHVTWQNQTNAAQFRGPYYHVVERSTDPTPTSRFSGGDTSLSSFVAVFDEDRDYNASPPRTSYEWTDPTPPAGTLYYRVKACSLLRVDYDHNGTLDDVCAAPAPAAGVQVALAPASASRAASMWDAVRGAAAAIIDRIGDFFARLARIIGAVELAGVVEGAQVDLNAYFSQFAVTLSPAANPSVYRDDNLGSDTVYLYRVKAVYTDGKTPAETFYTNEGAGKTFAQPAGEQGTNEGVNVCVRNNLCGPVPGTRFSGQPLVPQCAKNADCRDVGTSRQFFEETR